ncbi:MAG: antirestriction protein [Desulfuromonadaceae bacterium]
MTTIHRIQLNEDERINYHAYHFGDNFPFKIEPFIFDMSRNLSGDYTGGCWNMYELTNGGFYMAPDSETPFKVTCMNGYEGTLSADGFGIAVCLYAYSTLSFSEDLADVCAEQYHLLQECMFEHPEVKSILAAID